MSWEFWLNIALILLLSILTAWYATETKKQVNATKVSLNQSIIKEKLDRAIDFFKWFNDKEYLNYKILRDLIREKLGDDNNLVISDSKYFDFMKSQEKELFRFFNLIDALGYLDSIEKMDYDFIQANMGFFIRDMYNFCWKYTLRSKKHIAWPYVENFSRKVIQSHKNRATP
jgi:hypothetical protein